MRVTVLIFFCFWVVGCSVPTAATYRELYSFTKEEKKIKGTIGKKKVVKVYDFRENDVYEEDMAALKEEVEKYIVSHPDLNETAKVNLQELKVTEGATKEEVELLLGRPDKISNNVWIYKINKIRVFTVFIIPIFPVHEGYYLYFKDDILVDIERHYLTQVVQQSPGPGVFQKEGKTSAP